MDTNKMLAVKRREDHTENIETEITSKAYMAAVKKSGKRDKLFNPVIIPAWCKSCGICGAFCPKNVVGTNDMGAPVIERPDECIGCRFCELHCPDFAITIQERNTKTYGNQSCPA
jgi:2-oxoglutarate ferredoxin oxidoreductase subunit delta